MLKPGQRPISPTKKGGATAPVKAQNATAGSKKTVTVPAAVKQ